MISRVRLLTAMLWCLLLAIPAVGQTTRQASLAAANTADQALENENLRITPTDAKPGSVSTATGVAASGAGDLSRIAIALVIVIGVILVLRSGIKHMGAMPGAGRNGKLVTVLSRSMVSPRQQVLVLQVGKRLLVVGDSGGRMNPLCEISDPDEIAMMVGQTRQSRDALAERNPKSFLNLFRRANEPFTETEALAIRDTEKPIDPDEAVSSAEMHGLMEKVRMLQEQFRAKA